MEYDNATSTHFLVFYKLTTCNLKPAILFLYAKRCTLYARMQGTRYELGFKKNFYAIKL